MSLPCSDQDYRPRNMKDAILPPGVEHLRCWCGTLCKVKESTDFSDKMGMKFFMCPNYQYDPAPWSYNRPPSPPPLCIWYRWIDTEQPEWALREIEERSRRAWQNFHEDERREKEAEERRAAQQEQRRRLEELRRQREEQRRLREEDERQAREAYRQTLRERAAEARAAEERGDKIGKWPRWTQDD